MTFGYEEADRALHALATMALVFGMIKTIEPSPDLQEKAQANLNDAAMRYFTAVHESRKAAGSPII